MADETTVVARARDGNVEAFATLIDTYQTPLFRYALRLLDDRDTAEDVVQETFVAAWRGLPALAEPAAFRGWLYRIATRRAFDVLRSRHDHVEWPDEDSAAAAARTSPHKDPAQTVVHRAQFEALQHHVSQLPPQQRAAWTMQTIDGLRYDEIALALNLPPSTVRGRIARARHTLADNMASWR